MIDLISGTVGGNMTHLLKSFAEIFTGTFFSICFTSCYLHDLDVLLTPWLYVDFHQEEVSASQPKSKAWINICMIANQFFGSVLHFGQDCPVRTQ